MKNFCSAKDTIKGMKDKACFEKYTYPKYTKNPPKPTIRRQSIKNQQKKKKSAKDLDRHLIKEDIQMTSKHCDMLSIICQ